MGAGGANISRRDNGIIGKSVRIKQGPLKTISMDRSRIACLCDGTPRESISDMAQFAKTIPGRPWLNTHVCRKQDFDVWFGAKTPIFGMDDGGGRTPGSHTPSLAIRTPIGGRTL
ncbi:hypothetical protein TELCIR_23108 [Teladorsagia circumcincta]|uniref:Uncharacterized protein n=1 Tax=Teladorsagia circumcincta TaxID=45464 RepID=A0A2G9TC32_TELCI|nr:hypothetical protein TELCIR_23108 [Teladorsagia circumcincta]